MNVAIIPARGGSKRIPKKNIRPFCGKPMIAYSIEAARESGLFERIIVSTDSQGISEVALQFGAEVPYVRPDEISGDRASTDEVVLHALQWFSAQGTDVEYACCLYATAPFVQPCYLQDGLKKLMQSGGTSAISVTTFPFPIFRGLRISDAGKLQMFWPEHKMTRSQDLPEAYHDAGQFYWVNVERYLKTPHLYAEDAVPVVLPRHLVQDIDDYEDWARAENMFKAALGDAV